MSWVCQKHQLPLTDTGSGLACPDCPAPLDSRDGVVRFDALPSDSPGARMLDLKERLAEAPGVSALATCEQLATAWNCSRDAFALDWKLLLPLPDTDPCVLLLGETLGDDALSLAARGARVHVLVADENLAALLARRLAEHPDRGEASLVLPARMGDVGRLPLADESVDALCLEEHVAARFAFGAGDWRAVAREWRRVLRPGGMILLASANPIYRLPGLAAISRRLRRGADRDLEAALVAASPLRPAAGRPFSAGALVRELRELGLRPSAYAPFPDRDDVQVLLPTDDREVIAYFLGNLIRRHALPVRVALSVAGLANRIGIFAHLMPYRYVVLRHGAGALSRP